nr:ADP-ribosylglycohydrolase family protein [uncultured Sphaerochaeta sp.]
MDIATREKVYAGVVGKIIGVYLGRPVEGWTYEKIRDTFGEIDYYVNDTTKAPLIVPDDDISGTFAFIRSLSDHGCDAQITSKQIGNGWLNYIVEDKTILWWGGLSRSTEHTAYLRLKQGIDAPRSGSIAENGESMATQIGAQIFIDSWALVCPNDPKQTACFAREAARVSHDGIAVEAAVFLAVMESLAFSEKRMDVLIESALCYVESDLLKHLVTEIRECCALASDWKEVRSWIAKYHGYDKYLGNCPMVTNHLVVLMALIMGGDDFQKSISIAVSAGWDTDCNAGNVGCLNGIRLGLEGIEAGADFRTPVADRMLVVTADGGSCISDAVQEAQSLIAMSDALYKLNPKDKECRFNFAFPGSLQGFMIAPGEGMRQTLCFLENTLLTTGTPGLRLSYRNLAKGTIARSCVETFTDLMPKGKDGTSYFEVMASPTLYSGQCVSTTLVCEQDKNPVASLYIQYYQDDGKLLLATSEATQLKKGEQVLRWEIPDTNGFPIYRIGLELTSRKRLDGSVIIRQMDWRGAPKRFSLPRSYEMSPLLTPWTTDTIWLKSFMSSAKNFYPDYTTTFSISHPEKHGVVTIGTQDWDDYIVQSTLTIMQQEGSGLVARSRGHRRYYAALIQDGKARIVKQQDSIQAVLAESDGPYPIDTTYQMSFSVYQDRLTMELDGKVVLKAVDKTYLKGAAGFVVNTGAVLIDGFTVSQEKDNT